MPVFSLGEEETGWSVPCQRDFIASPHSKRAWLTEKHSYILGDIGPVGRYEPSLNFKPFLFAKGDLSQIFLPISDRHMIVGISDDNLSIPDSNEINEASASLSQYYFISSKKGELEKKLSQIISTKSSNIEDGEIHDIELKINKEWFGIEEN